VTFSGLLVVPEPTLSGYIHLWVAEGGDEDNPRRETIVPYSIGGNPSKGRGGYSKGRGGYAPLVSPDGQMIFFAPDPIDFQAGDFYTIQQMATLPALPPDKRALGPSYNFVATPGAPALTGSISFQYLGLDALTEGVDETTLTIHYWDGLAWMALPTVRNTYYNLASASSQGPGVYALLAGVTTPQISQVSPAMATNDVTTTLVIEGEAFLPPVSVVLVGSTSRYTLPLRSVGPVSLTAVVSPGLQAQAYAVAVINGDGGLAPEAGRFALFTPAEGCFYDFFESGSGQWQISGDWGIVRLADGNQAMTDSPEGPYKGASDYGPGLQIYTTTLTSPSFSLSACPNPSLTFQHDYRLARLAGAASEDVGRVEISTDGGESWIELARYSGGGLFDGAREEIESFEWAEVTWQPVRLDLTPYLDQAALRLRFSLSVNDDALSSKGWLLDNIMVAGDSSGGAVFLPLILK